MLISLFKSKYFNLGQIDIRECHVLNSPSSQILLQKKRVVVNFQTSYSTWLGCRGTPQPYFWGTLGQLLEHIGRKPVKADPFGNLTTGVALNPSCFSASTNSGCSSMLCSIKLTWCCSKKRLVIVHWMQLFFGKDSYHH